MMHIPGFRLSLQLTCFLTLAALLSPVVNAVDLTSFQRMARYLENGPEEQRAYFAGVALSELALAYQYEVEMAREGARSNSASQRVWSGAVRGYALEMLRLKNLVDQGMPLSIVAAEVIPMIAIGDNRVMLTYPRPEEQLVFEQKIMAQFCESIDCEEILAFKKDAAFHEPVQRTRVE